jgi:hypothetical protein
MRMSWVQESSEETTMTAAKYGRHATVWKYVL